VRVVIYGKPGCCLCVYAEDKVRALGRGRALELVMVNILEDPAAGARFRDTIPAIEVDGVLVSEGRLDERAVARALAPRP